MPELPDITVYVEAIERRVTGVVLQQVRIASPFVLRSVDPPIGDAAGRRVSGVRRMGKRIVLALEPDRFLILHLMIAGRLRWRPRGAAVPREVVPGGGGGRANRFGGASDGMDRDCRARRRGAHVPSEALS